MNKISAVYKIVNTITNDSYVGSSKNAFNRWACHKSPSRWEYRPNNPLYQDMQKYGVEKFRFQILAPVMPEYLKQVEQELIEMIQPTYNNRRADGIDAERRKEYNKKYNKNYSKEYNKTDKGKEAIRKYRQSKNGKEALRKTQKKYWSQLCSYNGETLTLSTLVSRFYKAKIEHPILEAKKYLKNS